MVTVLLTIAIGILATSVEARRWHHLSICDRIEFDPVRLSLTGYAASVSSPSASSGSSSSPPSTGRAASGPTLGGDPQPPSSRRPRRSSSARSRFVVGEAVAFAAFFIGQAILSGTAPHAVLGQPGVLLEP